MPKTKKQESCFGTWDTGDPPEGPPCLESLRNPSMKITGWQQPKNWHRNQKERSLPSHPFPFLVFREKKYTLMKSKIPYQKWMAHILKPESPFSKKAGPSFWGPPAFYFSRIRKVIFDVRTPPTSPGEVVPTPCSTTKAGDVSWRKPNSGGTFLVGSPWVTRYWAGGAINKHLRFFKDIGWCQTGKNWKILWLFL